MSDLFHTRFPGLVCTATWQNSEDTPWLIKIPWYPIVLLIEIYEDFSLFALGCWFHSEFVRATVDGRNPAPLPRAYTWNLVLLIWYCFKTQWSKWICASDGNLAPPVSMSFNIELGGTGVHVMHWQMYGCRGGAGFLPPTVSPASWHPVALFAMSQQGRAICQKIPPPKFNQRCWQNRRFHGHLQMMISPLSMHGSDRTWTKHLLPFTSLQENTQSLYKFCDQSVCPNLVEPEKHRTTAEFPWFPRSQVTRLNTCFPWTVIFFFQREVLFKSPTVSESNGSTKVTLGEAAVRRHLVPEARRPRRDGARWWRL